MLKYRVASMLISVICVCPAAFAQTASTAPATPPTSTSSDPGASAKPDSAKEGSTSLAVYFKSGSSSLGAQDKAILDQASRTFNEGKPIVMILTGSSDRAGSAAVNLELSQKRATAVLQGLLSRGIPADRFQVVAKGETDLPVPTSQGVAEAKNRRVEITWR